MQQKINYKDTLNLPRTNFPMKASLQQKEPLIQKSWEKENLFGKIREKSRNREKFLFHDGPPYANGPIHLGHLLNKVLKDLVVRSKILEGFNVDFVPGWDCHGLPIEHKVLKELGEDATAMPALSIRRSCGKYAAKYVKMQSKQMIRLGTLADYKNPYLTMTPDYEAGVLEAFSKLLEKGLVYRDLKPVHLDQSKTVPPLPRRNSNTTKERIKASTCSLKLTTRRCCPRPSMRNRSRGHAL